MFVELASPTPHLILGGAKSGKSAYAERLISALPSPYVYVATAEPRDAEMTERIDIHRRRRGADWKTVETPLALLQTLQGLRGNPHPVLVDCITLWLSNLLLDPSSTLPEEAVSSLCTLLPCLDYPLFLVSNEVGGGIVPDNSLARRFRDLSGTANQQLAEACRSVTLVAAGLPLILKQ